MRLSFAFGSGALARRRADCHHLTPGAAVITRRHLDYAVEVVTELYDHLARFVGIGRGRNLREFETGQMSVLFGDGAFALIDLYLDRVLARRDGVEQFGPGRRNGRVAADDRAKRARNQLIEGDLGDGDAKAVRRHVD